MYMFHREILITMTHSPIWLSVIMLSWKYSGKMAVKKREMSVYTTYDRKSSTTGLYSAHILYAIAYWEIIVVKYSRPYQLLTKDIVINLKAILLRYMHFNPQFTKNVVEVTVKTPWIIYIPISCLQ